MTISEDKRLKVTVASQSHAHRLKNLKRKLHNCNVNIFCSQECLRHKLIPNYARKKIPHTSKASKQTYNRMYHLKKKTHTGTVLMHVPCIL